MTEYHVTVYSNCIYSCMIVYLLLRAAVITYFRLTVVTTINVICIVILVSCHQTIFILPGTHNNTTRPASLVLNQCAITHTDSKLKRTSSTALPGEVMSKQNLTRTPKTSKQYFLMLFRV